VVGGAGTALELASHTGHLPLTCGGRPLGEWHAVFWRGCCVGQAPVVWVTHITCGSCRHSLGVGIQPSPYVLDVCWLACWYRNGVSVSGMHESHAQWAIVCRMRLRLVPNGPCDIALGVWREGRPVGDVARGVAAVLCHEGKVLWVRRHSYGVHVSHLTRVVACLHMKGVGLHPAPDVCQC
jgi:hypothetical protein